MTCFAAHNNRNIYNSGIFEMQGKYDEGLHVCFESWMLTKYTKSSFWADNNTLLLILKVWLYMYISPVRAVKCCLSTLGCKAKFSSCNLIAISMQLDIFRVLRGWCAWTGPTYVRYLAALVISITALWCKTYWSAEWLAKSSFHQVLGQIFPGRNRNSVKCNIMTWFLDNN